MHLRNIVPLLSLLGPPSAGAAPKKPADGPAPMRALVLFGAGARAEDARRWREANAAALEELAAQGVLAPGFPVSLPSDSVPGLKPGYHVVIAGYCTADRSRAALALLHKRFPEAYERQVGMPPTAFSCPRAPAQRPAAAANAPRFPLGDAERLAASELAKGLQRGEEVEVLDRASGRVVSLGGKKPAPSAPGHVILATRVRTSHDEDGTMRADRPVLLFIAAGRRGKPAVIARLDLPDSEGREEAGYRDSTEMKLGTWHLSRDVVAVALVSTRGNGGDGYGEGSEDSTLYALSGSTFREIFSVPTYWSDINIAWETGRNETRGEERKAEVEILEHATNGLADLQVTSVTEKLAGCWQGSDVGPCPPAPGEEVEEGGAAEPQPDASGQPEPEPSGGAQGNPARIASDPEITRFCWNGSSYERNACK